MKEKGSNCPLEGFVREDALIPQIDREAQRAAEERAAGIFAMHLMSIMKGLIDGLSEEQLSIMSKSRLDCETSLI